MRAGHPHIDGDLAGFQWQRRDLRRGVGQTSQRTQRVLHNDRRDSGSGSGCQDDQAEFDPQHGRDDRIIGCGGSGHRHRGRPGAAGACHGDRLIPAESFYPD
ncbi:hypothetical protein SDC9_186095 [bioreactor metagenome]|uniref:Uncharacterized protein n=1 Tax=bioreactor metagenome TaxID=1076179 RepID=A0A645HHR9_9ZZZZ